MWTTDWCKSRKRRNSDDADDDLLDIPDEYQENLKEYQRLNGMRWSTLLLVTMAVVMLLCSFVHFATRWPEVKLKHQLSIQNDLDHWMGLCSNRDRTKVVMSANQHCDERLLGSKKNANWETFRELLYDAELQIIGLSRPLFFGALSIVLALACLFTCVWCATDSLTRLQQLRLYMGERNLRLSRSYYDTNHNIAIADTPARSRHALGPLIEEIRDNPTTPRFSSIRTY